MAKNRKTKKPNRRKRKELKAAHLLEEAKNEKFNKPN